MKRPTIFYGVLLALLLMLLRAIEYKYLILEIPIDYYVGILALLFTVLGVWVGRKLTVTPQQQIIGLSSVTTQFQDVPALSPREKQVLEMIALGHSN